MKEVKSNFTESQRKSLIEMITGYGEVWDRARDAYRAGRDSLIDTFIREEAERKGWLDVVQEVLSLKEQISAHESTLAKQGVELEDEGQLSFPSGDTSPLRLLIESKVSEKIGDESDVRQLFTDARAKLLTVETSEEAAKIVEPLLNFQVKVK